MAWPIGDLIEAFEQTCHARGEAPEQALGAFLGPDTEPDSFWKSVEANLRAGRIRMVFVADEIPRELRRIVEFLNEQMRPAEVLAVEVEQYQDDNIRTLVPRLIGATERAQATKAVSGSGRKLSLDEWLDELAANHGEEVSEAASRALDWFRSEGCRIAPTVSGDALSVSVSCEDGKTAWPFFIRSNAALETCLQYLRYRPAFSPEEARQELLDSLHQLPNIILSSTGKLTGWPHFPVIDLRNDEAWQAFIGLAADVLTKARKGEP